MKILTTVGLALLSVFAPAAPVLATAFALVLTDMITGMVAARKRGEPITSRGMRRSVTKLLVYEVAMMIAFLAGQYLIAEMPILKIVASMIGLTELRSIFENLSTVTDAPVIKMLIAKLGGPEEKK